MKIIDGNNAVLGRLASYVAKEALRGEEIIVLNCESVIITGNKKFIRKNFEESRRKVGSGQKGPKISRDAEKIVKRAIRGMLPNYRRGRGAVAYSRIKCYIGVPKEFEGMKKIVSGKEKKSKYVYVKEIAK
ncbi:50S ribosomal protein L13 [Candidatus Pacearchaeota archaeon]|nr:50S ribosomal protein L13 [Candidatus Pacearchaeota archaeon]